MYQSSPVECHVIQTPISRWVFQVCTGKQALIIQRHAVSILEISLDKAWLAVIFVRLNF